MITPPASLVERAWKLAYSRPPSEEERRSALAFIESQSAAAGSPEEALVDLCHTLLISNEFLYMN